MKWYHIFKFWKAYLLMTLLSSSLLNRVVGQEIIKDMEAVFITTPQLDSSFRVYQQLGYSLLTTQKRGTPGYLLFDGSLPLMLLQDSIPSVGLLFYVKDINAVIAELKKDSLLERAVSTTMGGIKQLLLHSPEGVPIIFSSNPEGLKQPASITLLNMKSGNYQQEAGYPNSLLGVFGELAIPVTEVRKSYGFWKKMGFLVKSETGMPYPYSILADQVLPVGLHQTNHFISPAITYFGINTAARVASLKKKGLSGFVAKNGMDNVIFTTWEKQQLFIFNLGM